MDALEHRIETAPAPVSFAEAFRFWLKLGFISFGGPTGQIAIMHQDLVERKRWISEKRFLHALNYCMLLPGPEATQLATYIGWMMHRTWGGVIAGTLFVLPSLAILAALTWIYLVFGNVPVIAGLFYGIKPAVTAIVLFAAYRIGSRALKNAVLWTISLAAFVAIFAFDDHQKLRLVNRAGEKLLGQPAERLIGLPAAGLNLDRCLTGEPQQTFPMSFPGGSARWGMRRSTVRERGLPLELIVISDITQPLREEELQAWQRLVRVLGHELNNSLTPIKSIAGSLSSLLARRPLPDDWDHDMQRGLAVITSRSEALSRFIGAYARLAKPPRPQPQPLDITEWIGRVVTMETRVPVKITPGPKATMHADPDQLEQVLINLLRNAADAALETGGGVEVGWRQNGAYFELWVQDEGPGLPNTANLFVPFFTTKPGGSGIGLVLSRQIAEAHGGSLTLENRIPGPGCEAKLRLPA